MAVSYGHYQNPTTTLFHLIAGAEGKVPSTTKVFKVTGTTAPYAYAPSGSSWTKFTICTTLATHQLGPGVLLTVLINPSSSSSTSYNTRVYIDDVLYHSVNSMSPSNNYLVGTAFDTMTAGLGSGTSPAVTHAPFKKGFTVEGYKNTTLSFNGWIEFVYMTYDLVEL